MEHIGFGHEALEETPAQHTFWKCKRKRPLLYTNIKERENSTFQVPQPVEQISGSGRNDLNDRSKDAENSNNDNNYRSKGSSNTKPRTRLTKPVEGTNGRLAPGRLVCKSVDVSKAIGRERRQRRAVAVQNTCKGLHFSLEILQRVESGHKEFFYDMVASPRFTTKYAALTAVARFGRVHY